MSNEPIQEIDLVAWVGSAPDAQRAFREAVHIVLTAIGASVELRSRMIMKGGLLMAVRYDSTRFTRDVDFSTRERYAEDRQAALLTELDAQLDWANDTLPYDTLCRRQTTKLDPARADATYPTLAITVGYAAMSHAGHRARLMAGQSPTIVRIDYSYNEAVYDLQLLSLQDGHELQAYSFSNLLAEKYRALLQQPERHRYRRQDVYDLHKLLTTCAQLSLSERHEVLSQLVDSCSARGIDAKNYSMQNPQVKQMAASEYARLEEEITGALPDFEIAYGIVQGFYEMLPWDADITN
jgi:predicted nucleotidyltransferase component of viral defense system